MYDPIDDFRIVFPEISRDDAVFGWIDSFGPVEQPTLNCRRLPRLVRQGEIDDAFSIARELVGDGAVGVDPATLVRSLVAMADELLEGPHRAPARTRELVELLMVIVERITPVPGELLALSVAIHFRAADLTLTRRRLQRFDETPTAASPMFGGYFYDARLLGRWVHVQLGDPKVGRPADSSAPYQALDRALWKWLFAEDDVRNTEWWIAETEFSSLADSNPAMACNIVSLVLPAGRRLLGRAGFKTLPRTTTLFENLEQLVWLVPRDERPLLWSQLAIVAAAASESERIERFIAAALGAVATSELAPVLPVQADVIANLLDARVGFPGQTTSAGDEPPAAPLAIGAPTVPHAIAGPVEVELPDHLTEVLRSATAVLVAGPELPAANDAPGRAKLIRDIVGQIEDPSLGAAGRDQMLASIDGGNLESVARLLRGLVPDLEARIATIYQTSSNGTAYDFLAQLPLVGVISMCWDERLLDAFSGRSPMVVHTGSGDVLAAAKSQDLTFTWLAGDPQRGQLAIGSQELRSAVSADDTFGRFLSGTVQSSPLLFVGVRASDLVEFFEAMPGGTASPSSAAPPARFAVCAIDNLWELNRTQMRASYDVELIGYDPDDPTALNRLIERISYLTRPVGAEGRPPVAPTKTMLNRILLTNIGAFEVLDLELSPAWNLLLGNNGCGKSTVLRAIALGLCGDHPRAMEAGEVLLRAGCDSGVIELHVGTSRYVTELRRYGRSVRVTTTSLTPLQQGNWVVLGFPALRGMSQTGPTGISSPAAPEARVEDLLPLLLDELDHRLDDIKQWIINVDARSRLEEGARSKQLLERFFEVLATLTPGLDFKFERVDSESWEVIVRTNDGVISIDQLSQGMSSIIAWVGTLLQRMYDIYSTSSEPAAEGAFVLIDELDAHLHPAWQRELPDLTRKHFPNVQYLATSHSPLVAASLEPGELFVARREPREDADGNERMVATITVADVDPRSLRADQILTSPLFGLAAARSPKLIADTDRYGELFTKENRTPEEETELARLAARMRTAYTEGWTPEERAANAAKSAKLQQQLDTMEVDPERLAALQEQTLRIAPDGQPE